jgi:hypothetical protein
MPGLTRSALFLRQNEARLADRLRRRIWLWQRSRRFQLIEDRPQRLRPGCQRPARLFDFSSQQRHELGALVLGKAWKAHNPDMAASRGKGESPPASLRRRW